MFLFIKKYQKTAIALIAAILILCFAWLIICLQVSKNFPIGITNVHISKNASISSVADDLYSKHIINSAFIFKVAAKLISRNMGILAGDYRFTQPQNTVVIAYRMVMGEQGIPRIKVTIPEGTNVADMAYIYLSKLDNFDAPHFVALAKKNEGYLFPDTYTFFSNTSAEQIISEMKANFDKKTKNIKINKNDIILASIIEEEAKGIEDKKMVSGILKNRLNNGMLLQVDPPFYYITGKTGTVTFDDLKIDSPYNTYKYRGLPIGPISNPGIESINAAINPTPSKYLFYLTGKDGIMRYATTYEGHLINKEKYLN